MTQDDFALLVFGIIYCVVCPFFLTFTYKYSIKTKHSRENVYQSFRRHYPMGIKPVECFYMMVPVLNIFIPDFMPVESMVSTMVFYWLLPVGYMVYIYVYYFYIEKLRKISGLENVPYGRLEQLDIAGAVLCYPIIMVVVGIVLNMLYGDWNFLHWSFG